MMPSAVVIGLGATLIMDVWNVVLKHALGIPSLDYCLLGRWVRHMPEGTFRHARIGAAEPKPCECAVGWVAHYTIGVAFAVVFIALAPADWLERPTLLPAIAYGLVTVASPFLILQPALGLGIASSRAPDPMRARLKSLVTHLVFGVGLWGVAASLSSLTP